MFCDSDDRRYRCLRDKESSKPEYMLLLTNSWLTRASNSLTSLFESNCNTYIADGGSNKDLRQMLNHHIATGRILSPNFRSAPAKYLLLASICNQKMNAFIAATPEHSPPTNNKKERRFAPLTTLAFHLSLQSFFLLTHCSPFSSPAFQYFDRLD